jgi:putative peptidoglycan lipid II flippase
MNLNSDGGFTPQKVARATGIVIFLTATARILSYFKIVVLADRFGTSLSLDVYLLALIIPTLLGIQVGDGLTSSVIPVLGKYSPGQSREKNLFFSALVNSTFFILFLVTLFFLAGAPFLSRLLASGIKEESLVLLTKLLSLLLLTVIFNGMMGILRGFLQFEGNFALPASFLIIRDSAVIAFIWFLSGRMGILSAAYGNLSGALIGFLLLVFGLMRKKIIYKAKLYFRHPAVLEVLKLMLPILGVMVFTLGNIYVDRIMVSNLLTGRGNISVLAFAFWVVQIPVFIFVSPLSTVFFPLFCRLAGGGEKDKFGSTVSLGLRLTLLVTVPAITGLVILRVPLIGFLLEHGLFNPGDTQAVSRVLLYYSGGILSLALFYILTAACYALKKVAALLKVTMAMFFANIVFNFILIHYLGLEGVALSTTFVLILGMIILVKILKENIKGREIITSLFKFSFSTLPMAAGCFFLAKKLEPLNFFSLMMVIFSGLVIYLAFLFLARTREVQTFWNLVIRRR